jgi:hypothetical protein
MGYDVEPLVTLETKRRILTRAVEEGWLVVFEHDANVPWGHVAFDGKAFTLGSPAHGTEGRDPARRTSDRSPRP